jgi:hypothetical protein
MSKALLAILCSSWLALAPAASAQAPAPRNGATVTRDAATAEALFRQGRLAIDNGRFQDACPKFAESQRLDPAAGTLMNLATCEEKLRKLASAWQHWKEAIDMLPTGDDRAPFAQSRVNALEAKLPHLTIRVKGPVEGASKVLRDQTEIGPAGQGVPLPVDAGQHVITVRAPGHFDDATTVTLAEGENKEVIVKIGAVDPAAAARLAGGEADDGSGTRTLGWALGGVGVAGLASAVTTGLMVVSKKHVVEAECNAETKECPSQEGADAASAGRTLLTLNTVSWVIAAAGLGAGAYFVISGSRSRPSATIAPTFGPMGGALSCAGTF